MADIISPFERSRMMSGIKSKNSHPEILIRQLLHAAGYGYRLHRRDLPGTPDIAMAGRKIAFFVHGCFWHAHQNCKYSKLPTTRQEFWASKFQANVDRDQRAVENLTSMGWRVLCIWECATRNQDTVKILEKRIVDWINSDTQFGEISGPL